MNLQLKTLLASMALAAASVNAHAAAHHPATQAASEASAPGFIKTDMTAGGAALRVAAAGSESPIGGGHHHARGLDDAEPAMVAGDSAGAGGGGRFSIPEPGDWAIVVAGLAAIAAIARRRMNG